MKLLLIICLILCLGIISWCLTLFIIKYSENRKYFAIPNIRSLHDSPTPTGGGIAIAITWYLGITVLYLAEIIEPGLYFALMSGIILSIISLIDDVKEIKPLIRLLFHFIVAIMAFVFLEGLRPLKISGFESQYNYIIYPLAVIGIVWFINLFNFMDGVDGFASVEVITIASVMFVLSWNLINIILIVSVAGFLCWNWPKAKIFMGDVGSTQLGFITVVLGIYFHNNLDFSILNWIMLTSPFWFDATLTLLRRWRNGENLTQAHRKHAYQRLVLAGYSQVKVNLILIIINVFIILLIVLYRGFKIFQVPVFIFSLFFYYYLTRIVDRKMPFNKLNSVNKSEDSVIGE